MKKRPVEIRGMKMYVPTFLRPGLLRLGIALWIVGFLLLMVRR